MNKGPILIGLSQFVYHILWYVNVRSTAQGKTNIALVTDVLSTVLYVSIIKRLVERGTTAEWISLIVGGTLGSWIGLHLPI